METFPAEPKPTSPANVDNLPDVQTIQLGRGYREDVVLSDQTRKSWDMRWANYRPQQIDIIYDFIRKHRGSRTFRWTDPNGETGLYRCRRWRRSVGNGIMTLTATLEEVNY